MIVLIVYLIDAWLDAAERRRREAYIANSKDLSDVERRIRLLENRDAL
jgi:hypothetical protein